MPCESSSTETDVAYDYFRTLKKALQMPCESCASETTHKPFEELFQTAETTVIQLTLRQYNYK